MHIGKTDLRPVVLFFILIISSCGSAGFGPYLSGFARGKGIVASIFRLGNLQQNFLGRQLLQNTGNQIVTRPCDASGKLLRNQGSHPKIPNTIITAAEHRYTITSTSSKSPFQVGSPPFWEQVSWALHYSSPRPWSPWLEHIQTKRPIPADRTAPFDLSSPYFQNGNTQPVSFHQGASVNAMPSNSLHHDRSLLHRPTFLWFNPGNTGPNVCNLFSGNEGLESQCTYNHSPDQFFLQVTAMEMGGEPIEGFGDVLGVIFTTTDQDIVMIILTKLEGFNDWWHRESYKKHDKDDDSDFFKSPLNYYEKIMSM